MDRIVCEFCNRENPPDRTHCENCGAELHLKDRIGSPNGFRREPYFAAALASGPRAWAVLEEFVATGSTPRSDGQNPSFRPELLDSPIYDLTVKVSIPNRGPRVRTVAEPVPSDQVANLVKGLQLNCAFHPRDPQMFVVDWSVPPIPPPPPPRSNRWFRRSPQ